MDESFWHERWQRQDIGFHQPSAHGLLQRCWSELELDPRSEVFVPLCGKSLDMVWLAKLGHQIIGVELSEIAVRQFFAEQEVEPSVVRNGTFSIWSAGPYTLYCGDFFALPAETLSRVAAVYDRAALIALPLEIRRRYATHMSKILPPSAKIFAIAIDYPDGQITGPPFAVPSPEVTELFGDAFNVKILHERDGLAGSANLKQRGVTRLDETAYLLERK